MRAVEDAIQYMIDDNDKFAETQILMILHGSSKI
jgi:hypothetical protein